MAKEILDIYVEAGYPYNFDIDFNTDTGVDLEGDYTCWFENKHIGKKQYSVVDNTFKLTLTSEDTGKLIENLEEYVVYAIQSSNAEPNKLLSGRIVLDKLIRSV